MKKILALFFILSLIALVAGCTQKEKTIPAVEKGKTAEEPSPEVSEGISDVDALDEELNTSDVDTISDELVDLDW